MTVSDTADPSTRISTSSRNGSTAPLTSTRPDVGTCPPIAVWEAWIASRFREHLRHATMVDESNLARRDLLANRFRWVL